MPLTVEEIGRIAHLARIAVTENEALEIRQKLTGIFKQIEEMQAVDTAGVEPMSHAQNVVLRLREDQITEPDQRELFQSIAPQVDADRISFPLNKAAGSAPGGCRRRTSLLRQNTCAVRPPMKSNVKRDS
jgi:aspartyl-tRNA(Asn)/glutamyl-tRNA(Gln) amidotransferase subunit C